jgi:phosphonate transport system substrate-binding protein
MTKRLSLLAVVALVAAACGGGGGTTTTEPPQTTTTQAQTTTTAAQTTTTAAAPEVGTPDNPIQVLFVPSVSAEDIIAGGELLKQTLEAETGLSFEVSVPTSYAATIQEMCANPASSMGFIPAQAYVLGNELCGLEIALKALRFGYDVYWAQFITQRDSDIQTLEDLAGRTWAYPDAGSTSGFLVPSGILAQLGIEVGETVEAGGHSAVVQAVYNGDVDFGTTFYSPPTDAEGNPLWDGGPTGFDVPEELVDSCGLDADGQLVCGEDFFVWDARRNIREEAPDVVQKVKIIAVSDPIPNDGLAFGPEFPEDLKEQITQTLIEFAQNDPEGFQAAFDAYSWDSVNPATDAEFDSIRAIVQQLGITIEDL